MRSGDPTLAEKVLEHIAEIGAGRCSITDAGIADESDPGSREILAGLLMLHEDLDYARRRQSALLDDLRDAIRARDEFLLVASHELRTPITTLALQIDGLLRALNEKGGGAISENVTRRLALTKRQVDRLTALVAMLVDVSRITSGRLELSRERADLVEIVKAVTERFSDDALRSGSTLHLEAGAPISATSTPLVSTRWSPTSCPTPSGTGVVGPSRSASLLMTGGHASGSRIRASEFRPNTTLASSSGSSGWRHRRATLGWGSVSGSPARWSRPWAGRSPSAAPWTPDRCSRSTYRGTHDRPQVGAGAPFYLDDSESRSRARRALAS